LSQLNGSAVGRPSGRGAYNDALPMPLSTISALSPLDGRYAARLAPLRPLMSELGYMHRRVQVEVCWFIALSDAGFSQFKPLTPGARTYLLGLVKNFSDADALAIKEIERPVSSSTSRAPARTSTTPAMRCS
jgi:hypothetical protein